MIYAALGYPWTSQTYFVYLPNFCVLHVLMSWAKILNNLISTLVGPFCVKVSLLLGNVRKCLFLVSHIRMYLHLNCWYVLYYFHRYDIKVQRYIKVTYLNKILYFTNWGIHDSRVMYTRGSRNESHNTFLCSFKHLVLHLRDCTK